MKRFIKLRIFKILFLLILIILILNNTVWGAFVTENFNGEINGKATDSANSVQNVLILVLTVVRIVGMAIAIIMLIVVGIKIMIASPSEKANVKQYTMNYLIGAIILLTASGIVEIVKNVALNSLK